MDLYYSKRSVGVSVILSIVTCSIYGWVWLYQLLNTMYRENNQPSNAGIDIVLSIVTCGIYYIYLMYKMGKMESALQYKMGMPPKDDSVLYVILTIFGLWIVAYAIIQSNINNMVDRMHGPGPHGPHGPFGGGPGPGQWPGQGQGPGPGGYQQ